jgi:alpha-L-fucosidase
MKKSTYLLVLALILQFSVHAQQVSKTYQPTWESLQSHAYPEWFKDAKLGIFIHWGVYSVPSYGGKESYAEWYLRGLQMNDSVRTSFLKNNFGDDFTYRDFAPLFKAELFNPNDWADLFQKAGAKYVVMVAKHHDGYCLWPSKEAAGWNSVDVGPNRDLVGDLTQAVRKQGLKMGLYYSLPEWNNPLFRWYTDPNDQLKEYVDEYMLPQFTDLIHRYKPSVLFTDGEWFHSADDWHARELIADLYNTVGEDAIVNNRWGSGSDVGFLTPEYSAGIKEINRPWAECRGLGRSFGLNRNEDLESYLSPGELIHFFVKAVSNGGGMLLNVGPKADGQIPLLQQERLLQLGKWLEVNAEAIYGSKGWEQKQGQFREVRLERIDPTIDFDWVRNTPGKPISEDNFKVDWNGFIRAPKSGSYRFEAEVDDAAKVWINGVLVINKNPNSSNQAEGNVMESKTSGTGNGEILLKEGEKYPIRIVYSELRRNASMRLFWTIGNKKKNIVPSQALFSKAVNTKGDGLNAIYSSQYQYLSFTVNNSNLYAISLEWPGKELVLEIPKPLSDAKVNLLGYQEDLPWRWSKGKLHIDVSQVTYNEMPCKHAWVFRIEGVDL